MFLLYRYVDGDISSVYNHGYFRDYQLAQRFSEYLSSEFSGDALKIFKVSMAQFSIELPVYSLRVYYYIGKKRNNLAFFSSSESAEIFRSWMTSFFPFRKYLIFNNALQTSHMDTQPTLF